VTNQERESLHHSPAEKVLQGLFRHQSNNWPALTEFRASTKAFFPISFNKLVSNCVSLVCVAVFGDVMAAVAEGPEMLPNMDCVYSTCSLYRIPSRAPTFLSLGSGPVVASDESRR
jgi:hypothetical protein